MKFPEWLKVYGDQSFRGDCPNESPEQMAVFRHIRKKYPDTLGLIALHPKNEQKLKGKQFNRLGIDKAMGFCKSASDIIIPGSPSFVCELKRLDHTKSKWQDGQLEYLDAAYNQGAFVCVALGALGAIQAIEEWLKQ